MTEQHIRHDQALTYLRDHLSHAQTHRLSHALTLRQQLLRGHRATLITVGSRVCIQRAVPPRNLIGFTGTVQAITNDESADLLLDEPSTAAVATETDRTARPVPTETSPHLITGVPLTALTVTAPDEDFAALLHYLLTEATDEQLEEFNKARVDRLEQWASALADGDTVVLVNLDKKYLEGLSGTAEDVDHARCQFNLRLNPQSTKRLAYHLRNSKFALPNTATTYLLCNISTDSALIT